MTMSGVGAGRVRLGAAFAISAAMGLTGVTLALIAAPSPVHAPFTFPAVLLVPLYVLAFRYTLDFEIHKESHVFVLTAVPITLGALVATPASHLAARLVAALIAIAWARQPPVKAAFNVAAAALEVGAITTAVSFVPPSSAPSPSLWLALLVAVLIVDLVSNLALSAIFSFLGLPVTRRSVLQPLLVGMPATVVFLCFSVLAVTAAWIEPLTVLLVLVLCGGLTLAYRAHQRLTSQQHTTERLYEFARDLGPVDVQQPGALVVLDQVRELLHAERLLLSLASEAGWRHYAAVEGLPPGAALIDADQFATVMRAVDGDRPAGRRVSADQIVTPLLRSAGLVGILAATRRMGGARDFDLGDVRLLETLGSELATALERGRLLADLERAATTDPLTGLPNLLETTDRLDELIAASPEGILLAAVAVDSFREVNDTLGHQVGDDLLLEVTRRLRLTTADALVGRIGGGRFAVAVRADRHGSGAEMFGLGLRAQVEGGAQIGVVGTHVRLSVGCVTGPEHGSDAATLIRRAETAMYSARHVNGGPVLWEPAYEVKGQRRLAVVTALREALSSGAIGLAYQPKLDLASGNITGVEALARWTHPALGAIRPDEFVPLAEASGLMGPLTTTVLRQALTACKGWQRRAAKVGVAVNVSADTILDPAFVTEVAAVLTAVGVSPDLLTLELTEGVVVNDAALAVERLGELRALGVKISVDDFGTGYSSLTYLKGLPVDEVKIDKGFIDGLSVEPADQAVVRAVVDIAHTLGLKVVAEGVEQEDQQAVLLHLGVDEVQGYLLARPMAALDMAVWLRRRESSQLR